MRFVLAIGAFLLSAAFILVGVGQRTIWQPDPSLTVASDEVGTDAPLVVIDGAVLASHEGKQTVDLQGPDTVFAAFGRTADVMAWVGEAQYRNITIDEASGTLESTLIAGAETEVPTPAGSDLWLNEYQQDRRLTTTFTLDAGSSLLIASDGTSAPLSGLSVSWPVETSTPFALPLIVVGGILLLVGLLLYVNALLDLRRRRGPRRRNPPRPPRPLKPSQSMRHAEPRPVPAIAPPRGRRSTRRPMIVAPLGIALVFSALVGCAPEPTLDGGVAVAASTEQPTDPSAEVAPEPEVPAAVTVPQLERILARIINLTSEADEETNLTLLKQRFAGLALQQRRINYLGRDASDDIEPLPAVPPGPPVLTLPERTDTWPRTVMTVVEQGEGNDFRQVMLVLTQKDPRSNYRVWFTADLYGELPAVNAADAGAPRVANDVDLVTLPPGKISRAYADVIDRGRKSDFWSMFATKDDPLMKSWGADARAELVDALDENAELKFSYGDGGFEPLALATADSGAIVALNVVQRRTYTPTEDGNQIRLDTLCAAVLDEKLNDGFALSIGAQVIMSVPLAGSDEKITPIGISSSTVSCEEK